GQEVEIPTVIPTLSQKEINWLLEGNDVLNGSPMGEVIINKAIDFANKRKSQNKPFFYSSQEDNYKIPTANTKNWGQSLSGSLGNRPSVFEEYQQAKSLTSDDVASVKQDLDDEINNEGLLNN